MEFDKYQEYAIKTALYLNKIKELYPDLPPNIYKMLGLTYAGLGLGESGEVQGKIKKIIRDSGGDISLEQKEQIMDELGDQLWYISAVCTELNIALDDVAHKNISKLLSRKKRGVIQGSGDNR